MIQEELGEDAQILARSVYENYLAVSFLLANPDRLDDLVEKKIGVHTGYFKHPLNASGKKDRRRILDPRSGELVPFDVPIAEMLIKGRHSEDLEVHWPLYGFLSEHAHTHMVASGNYRAESQVRYSYSDPQQTLQASIWSTYVYLILLGEIRYFEKLDQADLKRSTKIINSAIDILQRAFEVLKFEAPLDTLPAAMMRRLSKITEP